MQIIGYIAALFIGLSLGLIGGGGSILTIPVLVYLFAFSPALAISYSLFIVGFTSLAGAIKNYLRGLVNIKTALLFGSASVTTVFITRKFIVSSIPHVLFHLGSYAVTYSLAVMVIFAVLMIAASLSMIRGYRIAQEEKEKNPSKLIMYGFLVGMVTGFLGAGGGFLIIPALVMLMRVPMKEAIGTSLLIIAMNSLIGFVGDIGHHPTNWPFLLSITAIATAGVFIGSWLGERIAAHKLKKAFGWFVLIVGIYILTKELFFT